MVGQYFESALIAYKFLVNSSSILAYCHLISAYNLSVSQASFCPTTGSMVTLGVDIRLSSMISETDA